MFRKHCLRCIMLFCFTCLFLVYPVNSFGTSIDRISICNLEGYPGDLLHEKITLTGTDAGLRNGCWENYYKQVEGDDERMNISSWITVEPREFSLMLDERRIFTIKVQIPADAFPGIWGAKSPDAGLSGHAGERRTYILFKDTQEDGNLYSGMLIPISVRVLGEASPFSSVFRFLNQNALTVFLVIIIIALFIVLLTMTKGQNKLKS